MKEPTIILLCAVLFVMVALEVSVLLQGKRRHGRGCGARKSARKEARRRIMRMDWRAACIDWMPEGETFPVEEKLLEHVAGMPEPYRSRTVAMCHEAWAAAGRFASLAVRRRSLRSGERREMRRLWGWLRDRGLLSLGFGHLRGKKWEER